MHLSYTHCQQHGLYGSDCQSGSTLVSSSHMLGFSLVVIPVSRLQYVFCACDLFCDIFEKALFLLSSNLLHLVYPMDVCLFDKIYLSVTDHLWVDFWALLREERNCLCKRAHGHTFILPSSEAHSVECRGMPFLDWSLVLLQTGEFCTLQ